MELRRRLIPNMTALRSFDCAARHLSFTRAAEELHLTQSSISRHIQELEAQLGLSLFSRSRRQIVLTGAGVQFQREAGRLLRDGEAMMLRTINTGESTTVLRIAAPPTFASRWLVPRLPAFNAACPDVQIDLMTYGVPFLLSSETCDLAFHFGEPFWPQARCRYLCSESVIPVCAPQLFRAPSEPVESMLERLPLLQNTTRPMLWQQWSDQTGYSKDFSLRGPRFDSFSLIIAAAKGAMGMALLPDYLIEDELAQGQLVAINAPALNSQAAYHIVLPEEGASSPMVETFATWAARAVRRR